jgi:hypothetical protein
MIESGKQTMEIDTKEDRSDDMTQISVILEEVDEQALIEERRRRRLEILAKHQKLNVSSNVSTPNTEASTSAGKSPFYFIFFYIYLLTFYRE